MKIFDNKYNHHEWWQQIGVEPDIFQGIDEKYNVAFTLVILEDKVILNIRDDKGLKSTEISPNQVATVLKGKIKACDSREEALSANIRN